MTNSTPQTRLMDAAERILIDEGRDGITTRRVAQEAGLNHGLVHYYYGSVDNLMLAVLERFTERLIERQRMMYALDVPFIEKWRTAMGRFLEDDLAAGYPKIWQELQAMAWNRPELRDRVVWVNEQWRGVLTEACTKAAAEYGLSPRAVPPIVALLMTFNQGLLSERLLGIDTGHDDLLHWIEGWLLTLEEGVAGGG
ncbi:MAG TPA: TetR/AcrR family transcriptional regulator [Gaiellales bacterium]|nr:TetR/AcrR family transcriptional regulator [Gaiellales bacterium]